MQHFTKKKRFKLWVITGAVIIGSLSTIYTNHLVDELKLEEAKKIKLWAQATRQLVEPGEEGGSLNLTLEVLKNNTTVPLVIIDSKDSILYHRNIKAPSSSSPKYWSKQLSKMKRQGKNIEINLGGGEKQFLYYRTSTLLTKLQWFPIIQLLIIAVFAIIAYLAFSSSRKAEQNQVWVGMAKETAHQLGTPISSLYGWIELMDLQNPDTNGIAEVKKDIYRLQNIADRFSKIGSKPILKDMNVNKVIEQSIHYLKSRSSEKVEYTLLFNEDITIKANTILMEWVFENLIKNAIDAIKGDGKITVSTQRHQNKVSIDIMDNGKGISKSNFKTVFEPGFTTKDRGWGLGLTLTKRIIEEYHNGKIMVKESLPGKKTVFRIII
ncbi:sensor histidine kinase [Saccharicrinis fermentans]|uniref:histidine kinase n=1 Tax=Saccharicrinis fermentans DSM 9555 = JCM 21142 TaxID=869213 RepID=W7Y390_9BACT|nr:HAMP domain-containing sensor histidine kinase [Saccharicrinis fermentans]GAF02058.1 sporulation kinase E [Saccharicrinis fermentans DSM 9555 = JCM 21142]